MARKKSQKPADIAYDMEHGDQNCFDDVLDAATKAANDLEHFRGDVFSANESLAQLLNLQMPALAPRFLLQSEGWPLGRFIMVDGIHESCKSSFGFEVGNWHRKAGGNAIFIETEQKDSSELRDSFFNYDRRAWKHQRARSQEQWNRACNWWVDQLSVLMDGRKKTDKTPAMVGRGRKVPFFIMIDSMSAVLLESQLDQITNDGSPGLNHPIHARLLADFFRAITKKTIGYPITLFAVNHLKMSTHPTMSHIQIRNTTGGATPKFQMTTEIEMRRKKTGQSSRAHPKYGEIYSIELSMHVRKNSLASKEDIDVEMCWYFDPDDPNPITGEPRQKSFFDWHSASIELLLECMQTGDAGKGLSTRRARDLQNLLDLHKNADRRQVWSSALGIGQDSRLSYFEAGKLLEDKIQSDPEFASQLYSILGIRRRFMFKPGVDMREQILTNTKLLEGSLTVPTPLDETLPASLTDLDDPVDDPASFLDE